MPHPPNPPQPTAPSDKPLLSEFHRIVSDAGGDPDTLSGKIVSEILHLAVKLVHDDADEGELKLISRSLKELRYALKVFRPYRETPKVSIFGSARTLDHTPTYQAAVDFSHTMAAHGWMVITGAGNGIMRAGHGGAGPEASFGVAIRLPFETTANEYIVGDPKLITFRYFFTRKLIFVWQSHAIALFPGGFGTQDEGFEAITLVQTGKAPMMPIVLIDEPGGHYWKNWDRYVRNELLAAGMISEQDLNLYFITNDPQQAVDHIRHFYSNYHSQRFVHDLLVLRIRRALAAEHLEELNRRFNDLIATGRIEQGGPLKVEHEYLDLPRLFFHYTKHDYGRLRLLINAINDFADAA